MWQGQYDDYSFYSSIHRVCSPVCEGCLAGLPGAGGSLPAAPVERRPVTAAGTAAASLLLSAPPPAAWEAAWLAARSNNKPGSRIHSSNVTAAWQQVAQCWTRVYGILSIG